MSHCYGRRSGDKHPNRVLIIAMVLIVCMLMMFSMETERDYEAELAHYCEMVEIFKRSDGEYGWPDYDEKYDSQCTPKGE